VSRYFRIWQKKRGARRTGSNLLGNLGEGFFFALLALIGVVSLSSLVAKQLTDPGSAAYAPGFGFWVMFLVLSSFTLLGSAGIVRTLLQLGTSVERRAALAKRAANLKLLAATQPEPTDFPAIPRDDDLTNSPGIRLTYRLPTTHSPVWQLSAATAFCLLWNGMAAFVIVVAIRNDAWLPTILAIPFLAVGVWSVRHFLEQMLLHNGIGPTIVEISEHPLYPGKEYRFFVSQSGRLKLRSWEVFLVCEEEATYHQGTDVRTATCVVHEQSLFRRDDFQIEPLQPLECESKFCMPRQAIHSFCSPHNRVLWKLVVRAEVEAWPMLIRAFPLVVYPPPRPQAVVEPALVASQVT
jgi:hypothetical protein